LRSDGEIVPEENAGGAVLGLARPDNLVVCAPASTAAKPVIAVTSSVRPQVMGIVNVTPDSFSDGGRWLRLDDAVAHGLRLIGEGADVLDIGGESTRPGAKRFQSRDELARSSR